MNAKNNRLRPRLITLLTILLLLQVPALVTLGLNLLTQHWAFLTSLSVLWEDIQAAFRLTLATPGELVGDEILSFKVIAFIVLLVGAAAALFAGVSFHRGRPIAWIMSLLAQIATLVAGIGLYFIYQPDQSFVLIGFGILMVLYLNYGDVRQWFLQDWGKEDPSGNRV
jgi:hypothetical protein